MKKTFTAFVAAAAIAAATMPTPADARCNGCAVGAGVVGGLVAGALIGGAIASSRPVYAAPAPVYVAPPPTCVVEQQVWSNRYQAWVIRPVRVAC
jgi:hypothetical protein